MRLPKIDVWDRHEFICSIAQGRKVLHVGCAEWPFTERAIKERTLLHRDIEKIAASVVGVDISAQALTIMQEAGFANLVVVDDSKNLYSQVREKYEVVIAGETLEHCGNALQFLESLKSVCADDTVIVLTTPNATPIKRVPRLLFRRESVHPDHVAYYSYSTLTQLFSRAALHPFKWGVYWRDFGRLSAISNKLLRRISVFNYFADGFCVACLPECKPDCARSGEE